jgi:broad specificity phosphatase PhoE
MTRLPFDRMTLDDAPPAANRWRRSTQRVAQAFARIVALRDGLDGNLAVVTHGS